MGKVKPPEVVTEEWKLVYLRHKFCSLGCQLRGKGDLEVGNLYIKVDVEQQRNLVKMLPWKQIMKIKFARKGQNENQKDQAPGAVHHAQSKAGAGVPVKG